MRTAIAVLFLVSAVVVYYWLQREHERISQALAQSQEAILATMQPANSDAEPVVLGDINCNDNSTLLPIAQATPTPYGEYVFALDSNSVLQRSMHPLAALFEKTTPPSQHYEINNKKEVVIKSKLGTVVSIPSNCFVNGNGKTIEGKIDVELKEVFSTSDLLLANLYTNNDDGMWITEGAFYLDATANGKKLKINPSKWIYVQTNTAKNKDTNKRLGFSLFNSPTQSLSIEQILPTWLYDIYRAFSHLTPALNAGFSGKEVFEQLKSYDTMLRRMDLRTPQAPPINFEDTIQKHITPKYRSSGKNTYVITQTGWTNINRYLPINKPKKSLTVEITGSDQDNLTSSAFLVFKNHKTILPGKIADNGKFVFNGVPIKEKAYLVGLGYKNNQPYIDIVDVDTDKTNKPILSLRATTFDMLKYQISQLN